jgi:transposase
MERCAKLTDGQIQELKVFLKNKRHSQKEIRRAQSVLLLNQSIDIEVIQMTTGYSRRRIFFCRKSYLQKGLQGITDKRKKPITNLLTAKQRQEVNAILSNEKPKAYGYKSNHWTTAILADLIEARYNVKYKSKTSYYVIFKENKFSFHKPGKVYEKHDPVKTAKWREEITPKLKSAMNDDDIIILAEDEMVLSSQTTFQKIWLPQGEYPKIEVSNSKVNRSLYGFLNIKTGKTHTYKKERQNMFITVECLKSLRKSYPKKKLLIFWDGAGWHRGSEVQKFIESDKNIEATYFPPYSPEENPQEHVWKAGRAHVTHNRFIKNIDTVTNEFVKYLNSTVFNYSLLGNSAVLKC